jgi:hypothetical protein
MTVFRTRLLVWFAAAILVLTVPHALNAQGLPKGTTASFDQPVEIPGHLLPAGTYTFVEKGRSVVQIWDKDQEKLYATLITNAAEQSHFVERQEFEFGKRESDRPVELKSWFLGSGLIGHEFIYQK